MDHDEDHQLRAVALRNADSIVRARQRAEEELVRSKEALELLTRELAGSVSMMAATLEATTDGILVTDRAGHVTGFNETYVQMWQVPREVIDARQHRRLVEWAARRFGDPARFIARADEIAQGGATDAFDLLELADGSVFERASRIQRVDGVDVGRVWSFRDITEATRLGREREALLEAERSARAAAERANRMKDEFLTTLSHELRTPLMAILGWSHVLTRKRDAENLSRGLEAITRNAKAQAQLIEDLLDMSRIVSGKVRLDVQPTDLADVVEASLDVVRPSADAKEIRLRKILDPRAGPVSGDPHRLQQIIWNLLSNAVKFTPKGGTIDVRLERVDSQVEITVADNGAGIDAEFLPHVFDRFAQSDASSTRAHGGLGLGLSIVKHLVELHGGSVTARSAGAGRGATFVVSLPVAALRTQNDPEHPATSQAAVLDQKALQLDGVKVLVLDDDPDARELIGELLAQFKAEVILAASAQQALALLDSRKPHVIVSDIGMPETDGYQFIRQVRSLAASAGGRTPAVALTAFARSEDRTRTMMAGYQMHIAKPIEPHELAASIRSLAAGPGMGGE